VPEVRWIEFVVHAQRVNVVNCIDRKNAHRGSVSRTLKDTRLRDASECDQARKLVRRKFNHADCIAACAKPRDDTRRCQRWKLRRLAHHGNECALAHARSSTGPQRKTARETRHSGLRIGCHSRGDPRRVDT
jgi:hypothetical protein